MYASEVDNWTLSPKELDMIEQTVMVTFSAFEDEEATICYDYQPDIEYQAILAHNPNVKGDKATFFSSQAPDPLELDFKSNLISDIETQRALGVICDVYIPQKRSGCVSSE